MGGDGGCVNTRVDMVKTRGYGLMRGQNCGGMGITPNVMCRVGQDTGAGYVELRQIQMKTCRISQQDLRPPIVVDRLGNLMNKESFMEALLSHSLEADHIRGLKDVKDVKMVFKDGRPICPITMRELDDGGCRSVALWSCGCVIEQKTMLTFAKKPVEKCPNCFGELDVIPLVPDDNELKELRAKLPERKKKKRPLEEKAKEGEEKKLTTVKVSESVAKMFKVGNTRDGFGCPAYVRRN